MCDAGEEEFLEIMALVGMASKPLHVRRLQKSLHEWVTSPSLFQMPLGKLIGGSDKRIKLINPFTDNSQQPFSPTEQQMQQHHHHHHSQLQQSTSPFSAQQTYSPSSITAAGSSFSSISNISSITSNISSSVQNIPSSQSSSSLHLTPTLTDVQVTRLASAAERYIILKTLLLMAFM